MATAGQVQAWINVERGTQTAPALKWTYPLTTTDYIPGNIYGAVVLSDGVLYFGDGKGMVLAAERRNWPPILADAVHDQGAHLVVGRRR